MLKLGKFVTIFAIFKQNLSSFSMK